MPTHYTANRRLDSSVTPINSLLGRLEGIRDRGGGRWLARCPAHNDHSASLSIRETDEGVVLAKCFAGCPVADVVAAVGLELSSLFPERTHYHAPVPKGASPYITFTEFCDLVSYHLTITCMGAEFVARGRKLSVADGEAVLCAADRVRRVLRVACHG